MDQWKTIAGNSESITTTNNMAPSNSLRSLPPSSSALLQNSSFQPPSHRQEMEVKDPIAFARKVQKADREKLRRDNLNEQFLELGNTLDPDRPKNDKATILTDAVQILKDLTSEVNRQKSEHAALSEESRELTQEKNELREEKASLKADIGSLNAQYQQRTRVMFLWGAVDPSVVMAPPYPYPMAVPPGPIPMHPSLQPFVFFGSQNPGAIPGHCSTFIPYQPAANLPNDQPSVQYVSGSHSSKQDSKSKPTDHQRSRNKERCDDSNDVATDLELKMPGSSAQQDVSTGEKKGKPGQRKERNMRNGSSSSTYSSSQVLQGGSSNSVGDVPGSNN